jgi:hypothetical protein
VDPLPREARRSYSGALAEVAVAESLAALGSEWTVLHSVPVTGDASGDDPATVVDHLVIGPAGIFTITIHSHSGQSVWVGERTFIVDGERLDHLASADAAGSAASDRFVVALAAARTNLDAVVTPCIVVDAPATLRTHQRPGRIQVVTARAFAAWLAGLPRLISPAAVDALAAVAVESSTWAVHPGCELDDAPQRVAEFARLRHRVASARFRRLVWTGLGVIVSYALVISSFTGLTLFGLTTAIIH